MSLGYFFPTFFRNYISFKMLGNINPATQCQFLEDLNPNSTAVETSDTALIKVLVI